MSKRNLLYIILFFSVIALFSGYFLFTKEGFEDQTTDLETQLNQAMTFFSEVVCPTYKVVLDDAMAGKVGSDIEKRISAELELQKSAGGTLFICPPPNDPVQIPADITARIQRTLDFFSKRLKQMKNDITVSLNQCGPLQESFQDICPPPPGQTTTPLDSKSLNPVGCMNIGKVDDKTRQQIIKARYDAVAILVNDSKVAASLAQIKADSDELLELKRKAENGELSPNCPSI